MQAHPVPQNIMQVEFQLVGNLTLRQFGYIAAAGLIAWAIFSTPLYIFIRLPIAAAIALFGVALAFLPVNDMRLEKWIIAFFKAIYSPTRRIWIKEVVPVEFLTEQFSRLLSRPAVVHTTRASNRARLDLYLTSHRAPVRNTIDELEDRKLQTLNFDVLPPAHLETVPSLAPDTLPIPEPETEAPRIVEENPKQEGKIASKVIFTPIATIKLPDRNIFVKPMSNKRSHSLNPKTAQAGTILLPIRGERLFQVSSEIKSKLNKYVQPRVESHPRPEVLLRETPPPPLPTQPTAVTPTVPPQPVEKPVVNVFTTPKPMPEPIPTAPPPPPKPTAPEPKLTPPSAPPSPPPAPPVEKPIINVFVTPTPLPPTTAPEPKAPEEDKPESVETLFPSGALKEVGLPPAAPAPEVKLPTPTPLPEGDHDSEKESLKENLKQLTTEQSQLKGEVERYRAQEKMLESQLTASRVEKNNDRDSAKLKELEEQILKMQHEKEEAQQRAHKLESLITQISTTQPKPNLEREIVTPQAAEAPKPPEVHVVAPRRAEGKMAPPMTTVPNVINGVVKDANGLLLSETIIVVKDKNDEPVRALKTNKVGQFAISTALPNGTYLMEVEKEGYEFDYIEIKLTGEILAPIEIRSRNGGVI